jgi:hypothetical protein
VCSQVAKAWQRSVSRQSRARAPLGLNDSRDYPELFEQAAEIANKNTAARVFTPEKGHLSLLLAVGTRNQQVRGPVEREMDIDTLAAPGGDDLSWPATD